MESGEPFYINWRLWIWSLAKHCNISPLEASKLTKAQMYLLMRESGAKMPDEIFALSRKIRNGHKLFGKQVEAYERASAMSRKLKEE